MRIERIGESLLQGWYWDLQELCLVNPGIGRIQMVAVLDDEGNERYHQPVWIEVRSEMDLVVDGKGRIAFVEQHRHAIVPPENYAEDWGGWGSSEELLIPHPVDLKAGVTQLELPGGFTGVLLREAEEETRFRVDPEPVACLGHICPNRAFFATAPILYVCRAQLLPADVRPDQNEPIRRVIWYTPEEASDVSSMCSLTLGGMYLFRRWALKQSDPFWHEIGQRL